MYKFRFGFMKDNGNIFELLYSDTDSFIFEIIGKYLPEIMYRNKEFFDLSHFPKDSKYYCDDNKKVPGKMKDEYAGKYVIEAIILGPKMCSVRTVDRKEKSIHKGQNSFIGYDEYEDTRTNKKVINNKMCRIKAKNYERFTYEINKRSLHDFDDKISVLEDGINTLPYGNKDIPKKLYFS